MNAKQRGEGAESGRLQGVHGARRPPPEDWTVPPPGGVTAGLGAAGREPGGKEPATHPPCESPGRSGMRSLLRPGPDDLPPATNALARDVPRA